MKIKFGNSVWKPVLVVINPCKITVVDAATNLMESYCTKATKHLTFNYRREYGAQKVSCNFKILMIFLFLMLYLCIKKVKQNSAMESVKHLCVIVQKLNTMTPLSLEYFRLIPYSPIPLPPQSTPADYLPVSRFDFA